MRRATHRPLLVLCGLMLAAAGPAPAQQADQINAIGLIDYSRPPDLKVGSWVKYRVTGSSVAGPGEGYDLTITIGGEEEFWGEECFWVETLTEPRGGAPSSIVSLMSYAIFQDSLAMLNMKNYQRKSIAALDAEGAPVQELSVQPRAILRMRSQEARDLRSYLDTLGTETLTVPAGTYETLKVLIKQGTGTTRDTADSTYYTEIRDNRTTYLSRKVPITSLVREEIEYSVERKVWMIGRSQNAPVRVLERSRSTAELIGYGEGRVVEVLPERLRTSLREQRALEARKPRPGRGGR